MNRELRLTDAGQVLYRAVDETSRWPAMQPITSPHREVSNVPEIVALWQQSAQCVRLARSKSSVPRKAKKLRRLAIERGDLARWRCGGRSKPPGTAGGALARKRGRKSAVARAGIGWHAALAVYAVPLARHTAPIFQLGDSTSPCFPGHA